MVRGTTNIARNFNSIIPLYLQEKIDKRFDQSEYKKKQATLGIEAPHFDLVRASVNLVVSSALIASATSLKLPLSTTYVTFMVAMGTSLSDRAWGRESAVYRITGVFSVIGGWFFTALSAFFVAFIIAMAIKFGGFIAILAFIGIAVFFVFRTHSIHKRRSEIAEAAEQMSFEVISTGKIAKRSSLDVIQVMTKVSESLGNTIESLTKEELRKLRKTYLEVQKINRKTKSLKDKVSETISHLEENSVETAHYYVQVVDYLREISHSITFITKPSFDHVDNNHKPFVPTQIEELYDMTRMIRELIGQINGCLKSGDYTTLPDIIMKQQKIIKFIDTMRKKQIRRIKNNEVGTRNTMLFLNILTESKNLVLHSVSLAKAHHDFADVANNIVLTPDVDVRIQETS
jgi:Na+/phosphate symporter